MTLLNFLSERVLDKVQLEQSVDIALLRGIDWLYAVLLPLLIIFIIAFYLGLERQNMGKEVGVSTHTLVGITSTVLSIVQRIMFNYLDNKGMADGSAGQRIVAQIITGVSFIGAGVVFKTDKGVRGLTSAAYIWAIAGLGIVLGSGYLVIGSAVGLFIMLFITIRDVSRGINPFIPTTKRRKIIKKYKLRRRKERQTLEQDGVFDGEHALEDETIID